jgi:nitrogen regulatory protein P-II 1
MKKIEAIIRVWKLDDVRQALHLHGVDGMTIAEVQGSGEEQGGTIRYRGAQRRQAFVPRIKLETVVEDDHADETVDAIYRAAHTGEVGDGRITVIDLDTVVRVRTGETQQAMHPVAH